ncbi:hypothetical protein [Limnobacter parvus]|uniref:Uncharacterized protein n=1 Tax=Limnobacter parvus TaxID=2939690 RepID=A0ABT1XIQ0_9BURK|nr:hypothetical protein [Limnobacter parvus]MCR2747160.1 hypothetical protein [Limnobacter parvus]
MMTLDLKAGFEALACEDNLHRIHALLTELDLDHGYSSQSDFQDSLENAIQSLQQHGVLSAYQQACVLLSYYVGEVDFKQFFEVLLSPQALVAQCVQLALNRGVPPTAYQHLHKTLAGVGRVDQAWLELQAEPDLLQGLRAHVPGQFLLEVACNHEGVIDPVVCSEFNTQANIFRSETGFQHKLFGKFTPEKLLAQMCEQAISNDPWIVSPNPIVERCELGINQGTNQGSGFKPMQQLEVVDARTARVQYGQRAFEWTNAAIRQVESAWHGVDHLNDAGVRVAKPFMHVDFDLHAGWRKATGIGAPVEFVSTGITTLHLPAGALQWHAHFLHAGVLVNLTIQAARDVCIDWNLYDARPAGQLPFGEPLLICQQTVPLKIQLSPVVCVGRPLLNLRNQNAGEMTFTLLTKIDPEFHRLDAELTLSHSELVCQWQAFDPLCGIASKSWALLPASTLMQWELIHG